MACYTLVITPVAQSFVCTYVFGTIFFCFLKKIHLYSIVANHMSELYMSSIFYASVSTPNPNPDSTPKRIPRNRMYREGNYNAEGIM